MSEVLGRCLRGPVVLRSAAFGKTEPSPIMADDEIGRVVYF